MSATTQTQLEAGARAWLDAEIAAGRLSPAPSAEVLGRIAAMLTGPGAKPRIKRVHRRLAPAQAQAPAARVGGLKGDGDQPPEKRVIQPRRPLWPGEGTPPEFVNGLKVIEDKPRAKKKAALGDTTNAAQENGGLDTATRSQA